MSATRKSLGRFILVGLTATLLHYVLLRTSLWLGAMMMIANLIGFVGSFCFTYLGNRFFVFEGKSGHIKTIGLMVAGYIGFALFHTSGMVGFTNGSVFRFLDTTLANYGGNLLSTLWHWLATTLPPKVAQLFFSPTDPGKLTTTITFLMVTSLTTIMSYSWNRFVVFKLRDAPTNAGTQNASAKSSVQ